MEMLRPMRRSRLRVIRVVRMMARMLELGMVKMMCQRPVFGMCSNTLCVPATPVPPSVFSGPGGLSPPVTRTQTQRCPLGLLPAHDHPSPAPPPLAAYAVPGRSLGPLTSPLLPAAHLGWRETAEAKRPGPYLLIMSAATVVRAAITIFLCEQGVVVGVGGDRHGGHDRCGRAWRASWRWCWRGGGGY